MNLKYIGGYEGLYSINKDGDVFSHNRGKFKATRLRNGYPAITLFKNGHGKSFSIHRLLAISFIPNPENKIEVNHINGIKTDFRLENLEWVSHSDNQKKRVNFIYTQGMRNNIIIQQLKKRKLTYASAKRVRELYKTGEYSLMDLSRKYGLHKKSILSIIQNKTYSRSADDVIEKLNLRRGMLF